MGGVNQMVMLSEGQAAFAVGVEGDDSLEAVFQFQLLVFSSVICCHDSVLYFLY